MTELADGARLLSECGGKTPPRVRIPLSPPRIIKASFCIFVQRLAFLYLVLKEIVQDKGVIVFPIKKHNQSITPLFVDFTIFTFPKANHS